MKEWKSLLTCGVAFALRLLLLWVCDALAWLRWVFITFNSEQLLKLGVLYVQNFRVYQISVNTACYDAVITTSKRTVKPRRSSENVVKPSLVLPISMRCDGEEQNARLTKSIDA